MIDLIARFSEPRWQTTRVSPRDFALSADASVRAFGTFPPAAGLTPVSGAGSGQYELRSMWPYAVAVSTAMAMARAAMVESRRLAFTAGQATATRPVDAPLQPPCGTGSEPDP